MIISLQVKDSRCANFFRRSSLCCCNSLLLTQHQPPFTHTCPLHMNAYFILKTSLSHLVVSVPPFDRASNRYSDLVGSQLLAETSRFCSSDRDVTQFSRLLCSSLALCSARPRWTGVRSKCVVDKTQRSNLALKLLQMLARLLSRFSKKAVAFPNY